MQTILVTGAGGFVGSNLCRELLRKGGFKVIALVRSNKGLLDDEIIVHKDLILENADIAMTLPERFNDYSIDSIVHLASQQPNRPDLKYEDYHRGNVLTSMSVADLACRKNVKKVVYVSTTSIFSGRNAGSCLTESSAPRPSSYYGITKYVAERLFDVELSRTETRTVILRCPSLIGKQSGGGLVHTYYELAKKNEEIEIYSRGERLRNLLHVNDLVKAIAISLDDYKNLGKYETFMVGSRDSIRMLSIANVIKSELGSSSVIRPVDKKLPVDLDVVLDISKATKLLGFTPMTVEEGLKFYIGEMNE